MKAYERDQDVAWVLLDLVDGASAASLRASLVAYHRREPAPHLRCGATFLAYAGDYHVAE